MTKNAKNTFSDDKRKQLWVKLLVTHLLSKTIEKSNKIENNPEVRESKMPEKCEEVDTDLTTKTNEETRKVDNNNQDKNNEDEKPDQTVGTVLKDDEGTEEKQPTGIPTGKKVGTLIQQP